MSTSQKQIVLVTGANGGIGYELARQLLAKSSNHVLLGARSVQKGEAAVEKLRADKPTGTVELLEIDVDDELSIQHAAESVETKHGRLDALVNNAAIAVPDGSLAEQMIKCYKTNVIGAQLSIDAFTPLLKKSSTPRIINVSSGLGSMTERLDSSSPWYRISAIQYSATKAALNMITADRSVELAEFGIKVFSYCPGHTVSNLSENNTADKGAKPTSEGAGPMVGILEGKRDASNAKFLHDEDGLYGW